MFLNTGVKDMLTLLTQGAASAKLAKDSGKEYLTAILYLASAQYDARLCPAAGACKKAELGLCLVLNSGRTAMSVGKAKGPAAAKIARTEYYFNYPAEFKLQLTLELKALERKALALGLKPAARLNGGSDLDWSEIYKQFPSIQFWEYTKRPDLAVKLSKLPNVSVTYSYSENTTSKIMELMAANKINIATVFEVRRSEPLPDQFKGMLVIDGDNSDLRFLDAQGIVVGLRFKSAKNRESKVKAGVASGFIQKAS
jgi:hypothetical protein